jgi:ABC-type nitrate/sulfonate/bicarbonate transport system permease component
MGARGGIGPLISEGEDAGRFDLMFAGIVTFAVLGFVGDRILMTVRGFMLRGQMIGTIEEAVR